MKTAVPHFNQVVQTSAPDEILQLFNDLTTAGLRHSPLGSEVCAAILEHLILRIAESAVPAGSIGTLAFETYQRCREHIENHHLELRSLRDLADACHLDSAYLCRLFGRYHHQSPYQYLTLLRMRHAARQLENPGVLAKQVAQDLHFSDQFQFSRTFRRVFGVSPRQFIQILPGRRK